MARRKVTASRKGRGRKILAFRGPSFCLRLAEDIIADIQSGLHEYYVREGPYESEVKVIGDGEDRRLVSTRDILSRNDLENLPNC